MPYLDEQRRRQQSREWDERIHRKWENAQAGISEADRKWKESKERARLMQQEREDKTRMRYD